MRSASEHLRGRAMGVRMLAIYGLPLGLLAAGALIDEVGFAVDAGDRFALAGRFVARPRAGKCQTIPDRAASHNIAAISGGYWILRLASRPIKFDLREAGTA